MSFDEKHKLRPVKFLLLRVSMLQDYGWSLTHSVHLIHFPRALAPLVAATGLPHQPCNPPHSLSQVVPFGAALATAGQVRGESGDVRVHLQKARQRITIQKSQLKDFNYLSSTTYLFSVSGFPSI